MAGRRAALIALATAFVAAALAAVALSAGGGTSFAWANRAPRALRGEGAVAAVAVVASPNKTATSAPAATIGGSTKPKQSPAPTVAPQQPQPQPETAKGQQQPGDVPAAPKPPQSLEQQPAKPQPQPRQQQQQQQQPAKPQEGAVAPAEADKSKAAHSAAQSVAQGATPTVAAPTGEKADTGASAGADSRSSEEKDPDVSGLHRGVNAGCFAMRGGKLLVVRQRSGAWSLPGGTGERGESSRRTAARETYEETGYRVSAGSLLTVWHNGFRIYRCSVHGRSGGSKDHHEVSGFGWKSAGQIRGMRWRFPRQAKRYPRWMR